MKVNTEKQRENIKRKRRLRKKLRVGEFKEFMIEFRSSVLNSKLDDETYDNYLEDIIETVESISKDVSVCLVSSDCSSSNIIVVIKYSSYSQHLVNEINTIIKSILSDTVIVNIDDAWYPTNDD